MKKSTILFTITILLLILTNSCSKQDAKETNSIPPEVTARVKALNLSTDQLQKIEGGYLAEGDIFLSNELLQSDAQTVHYLSPQEEHYRTVNLVTGLPRNISIRYTGATASISTAINTAITRFNVLGLRLTFSRVTTGGNIIISNVSGVSYNALSGFPSGGNPYNSIKINTTVSAWPATSIATLIAHEIGHCIGFAHTDATNPISCPAGTPPETPPGLGYILIPGTPSDPNLDPNSWMMRCMGPGINRPFTTIDKAALNLLY